MKQSDFVHLHLHTEYSLLDGACRISKLMEQVKKNGQTAVAITDHGVMYGCVNFYNEAKKAGIKPIIGCEVYVASRGMEDKDRLLDGKNYHLVLLCENEVGYQNLIYLVSMANIKGFYKRPRIDHQLLAEHSEGLIALSACISGEIPAKLLEGDVEGAYAAAQFYRSIFGRDRFYIELQNHGIDEQQRVIPQLIKLARELDLQLVATNDAHYLQRKDANMQKILNCIALGKTVDEENSMEFQTDEFYVKSTEEMEMLFSTVPDALLNTAKIADMCHFDFEFGKIKLPKFEAPNGDAVAYFEQLCREGVKKRFGNDPGKEIMDRLEYEISVIEKMGFVDYFLIVHDYVSYARSKKIPVGPGRGSGAGSLAAYCIGITGIDPIKNGLLFERFLNPERVSMPDFDIDFCYERRQEVIDYVVNKYGEDHVCQIVTFGTLAARNAVRNVARALGKSYAKGDVVAKAVPKTLHITLKEALKSSEELAALYQNDNDAKEILDVAMELEGMPKNCSTHAAGIVISNLPVYKYVPLQQNEGQAVSQYTFGVLESLGLLKMDFLGLRTLTVIDDAVAAIKQQQPDFNINQCDYTDQATFEMLSRGETEGVFQFESEGMKRVLADLAPKKVEDLTAILSLYRPGPMDSIPTYVKNSKHPDQITYATPLLKDILDVTYGVIVYQEQVMQICQKLAGFSFGQADLVRRAMAKKKHDVMSEERQRFLYGDNAPTSTCVGCINNGVPEDVANRIFDQMESFASYAFNKSHAACYAYVAFQTAYLKCHYPREFFAALLTSVLDSTSKVVEYMAECSRIGIKVLPPSINEGTVRFGVDGNNILYSLSAIKGLGYGVIEDVVKERRANGPFESLCDFVVRMRTHQEKSLSRKAIENMVLCGCFDKLENNRRLLFINLPGIIDYAERKKKNLLDGQVSLFGGGETEYEMIPADDYTPAEKLSFEEEILGTFMSSHPLDDWEKKIDFAKFKSVGSILASDEGIDNSYVTVIGVLTQVKIKPSKNGQNMLNAVLSDKTGTILAMGFSKLIADSKLLLVNAGVVVAHARVSMREDEQPRLVLDRVLPPEQWRELAPKEERSKLVGGRQLFIKVECIEKEHVQVIDAMCREFLGNDSIVFYESATKKYKEYNKKHILANTLCINRLKNIFGEENIVLKQGKK